MAAVPVSATTNTSDVITKQPTVNSSIGETKNKEANAVNNNNGDGDDDVDVDDENSTKGREQDQECDKKRRKSVSEIKLTIHDYEHDHRTDIPVIRQQNLPKFYIGTPERIEFDWSQKPKSLAEQQQEQRAKEMNPYLTAFHFNLKTIRDMQLEPLPQQRSLAASSSSNNMNNNTSNSSFSKLLNFKTKFKAFSHQKRTGSRSVPNFPIYS